MAARYQNIGRQTPMLLPECLQDWIPENDLAHFVIDAVALKLDQCSINHRGGADAQYPPEMMLSLLVYCYATGLFSSRRIEHATWQNVAVRYICANTHPDHDTLCTFSRKNGPLIKETFLKILLLAREMKLVKMGTVSIDGTKILANASKHAANSYGKAGELIATLEERAARLARGDKLKGKAPAGPESEDSSYAFHRNTGTAAAPVFTEETGPLNYIEWAVANFGAPPPPFDPSNFAALPEADPDGDGHQNLVEFAVNTSPVIPDSDIPHSVSRTPAGLLQVRVIVRNMIPCPSIC